MLHDTNNLDADGAVDLDKRHLWPGDIVIVNGVVKLCEPNDLALVVLNGPTLTRLDRASAKTPFMRFRNFIMIADREFHADSGDSAEHSDGKGKCCPSRPAI